MPINKNEITKEMLKQALECKTAEDLMYFDELSECELKDGELKHIAGGKAPGGGDKSIPPESRY